MIPTKDECRRLWDKYKVPENKRRHLELVWNTASYISSKITSERLRVSRIKSEKLKNNKTQIIIKTDLLRAAAMLHDIDKNVRKLPGERHPDASVRILVKEGMPEVAELVKTHPLHLINDPETAPKSIEEKILFLADKMVKYEIVGVDLRFILWNAEHLFPGEQSILDAAYPKVKILEKEIFSLADISLSDFPGLSTPI
jgi:HD superfamily phosphodiesterase